jgi:CDP-glycerol glycerophosphotransferase (TagB/SpsB family)
VETLLSKELYKLRWLKKKELRKLRQNVLKNREEKLIELRDRLIIYKEVYSLRNLCQMKKLMMQ